MSSSATARGTVIRGSGSSSEQAWSVEFGQWQIEAADAEHKRTEEHKEYELRRFILRAVVVMRTAVKWLKPRSWLACFSARVRSRRKRLSHLGVATTTQRRGGWRSGWPGDGSRVGH
jgi:hypothetical protein